MKDTKGIWELHSRKFRVLALDTVVAIILFFGAKYLDPSVFEDVKFLVGVLQLPVAVLIGAIAYEDGQEKRGSK